MNVLSDSVRTAAIWLGLAGALFLLWQVAETLLWIFAGILFGVFLDALTRGLGAIVPLRRGIRLAAVCLILAAAFAGTLLWGSLVFAQQWGELSGTLNQQIGALRNELENIGLARDTGRPGQNGVGSLISMLLPDPGQLFGGARTAFSAATGMLGSFVLVVLIGIFAAASPGLYRDGLLHLAPPRTRRRAGEVLDETADVLRRWLIGQLVAVVLVGVTVGIALAALGMPGALLLGFQAGLLNFIPYLGPFLAALPILLAAIPLGMAMLAWVAIVYLVIQTIEGYAVTPMILDRAVDVPPLLTLASLMVFGTLFGGIGIAMAAPFVAAARVVVLRLYVERNEAAARKRGV